MHVPGYAGLTLSLAITAIGGWSDSRSRDAVNRLRAHIELAVGYDVLAEISAHVPGTDRKHVDAVAFQLKPRAFSDSVHGKLAGRVYGHERHRDMSGNA